MSNDTDERTAMPTDTRWHTLTLDDLKEGSATRALIEETLESWAPNHLTDTGRIRNADEWIERTEGLDLPDGTRLDLGGSTDTPEWRALKKICRTIASESA